MKTKLVLLIVFFILLASVSAEEILFLELKIKANNYELFNETIEVENESPYTYQIVNFSDFSVELKDIIVKESNIKLLQDGFSPYKFKATFLSGNTDIKEIDFYPAFTTEYGYIDETSSIIISEFPKGTSTIKIYAENKEKLSINLNELICDYDNSCNNYENYYSCPSDCKINEKDRVCILMQDNLCDPDCIYDEDCLAEENQLNQNKFLYLTIIFTVLIIIILIIILKKHRRGQKQKQQLSRKDFQKKVKEMGFK